MVSKNLMYASVAAILLNIGAGSLPSNGNRAPSVNVLLHDEMPSIVPGDGDRIVQIEEVNSLLPQFGQHLRGLVRSLKAHHDSSTFLLL